MSYFFLTRNNGWRRNDASKPCIQRQFRASRIWFHWVIYMRLVSCAICTFATMKASSTYVTTLIYIFMNWKGKLDRVIDVFIFVFKFFLLKPNRHTPVQFWWPSIRTRFCPFTRRNKLNCTGSGKSANCLRTSSPSAIIATLKWNAFVKISASLSGE